MSHPPREQESTDPIVVLQAGVAHEAGGWLDQARECFARAIDYAGEAGDLATRARAYRRLAMVHHIRGEREAALSYCQRSREDAAAIGNHVLLIEASIAMANFDFDQGRIAAARIQYMLALDLASDHPGLQARIHLNLGSLDSTQGDPGGAEQHYRLALQGFLASDDRRGIAKTHHNIGKVHSETRRWTQAARQFEQALAETREIGDRHLEGLCALNLAEAQLALGRPDEALATAIGARQILESLGSRPDQADALRILGLIETKMRRFTLAESNFKSALAMAQTTSVAMVEAETLRDLGLLYALQGRQGESLRSLERAEEIFRGCGALKELRDVISHRATLTAA